MKVANTFKIHVAYIVSLVKYVKLKKLVCSLDFNRYALS